MSSSWRANLDSAFPPFVQGAPVKSVYERAGFDVNRKSPTESTYAESIRSSASQRSRKSPRVSSRHTNYTDMPSPMPPLPSSPRLASAMSYHSSPSVSRATTPMGYNPPIADPATASSTITENIAEQNAQPNQAQLKESTNPYADHQQGSEQQNEERQPVTRPNSQASSIYSPTHDPILLAKSPPIPSDRIKSLLPYQKEQQELQRLQEQQEKEIQGQSLEQILNDISAQKRIPPPLNLDVISNNSTKKGTPHDPHALNPLDLSPITEIEPAANSNESQLRDINKNAFGTTADAPGLAYSPMPSEDSSSSPTTSNDDDYNSTRTQATTVSGKPGVAFDMGTIASRSNSVSSNATTASNNPNADGQYLSVKSKRKVKGICRECNNQIIGKSVGASDNKLSGRWHKQCFCCMNCKSHDFQRGSIPRNNDYMGMSPPKTNEFYVLHDRPLCHACYHTENTSLCKACGAGIEGGCLDDGVSRYHVGCVRCTDCDIQLDPQRGYITVVAGHFYCPKHAELEVKLRESQVRDNKGETPVVEKRRTQLLMM